MNKETILKKLKEVTEAVEEYIDQTPDTDLRIIALSLRSTVIGQEVLRERLAALRAKIEEKQKERSGVEQEERRETRSVVEPEPQEEELDSLTLKDLRQIAKEAGIKNSSKMKKAEILDLLQK